MGQLNTAVGLDIGSELPTFAREVTMEKMIDFERVVWDRGKNSHNDPSSAKRDGLSTMIASGQNQMAFLHELLERNFGDSWVFGGKISVRYIHPVYAGDRITPRAKVAEVVESDGASRAILEIWCENQDGQKTAVGTARVGPPTQQKSWIDASGTPQ